MRDAEIGELWEWVAVIDPNDGKVDNWEVKKLIRKLVEERAKYIQQVLETSRDCLPDALGDFHIDPVTWEATKLPQNEDTS